MAQGVEITSPLEILQLCAGCYGAFYKSDRPPSHYTFVVIILHCCARFILQCTFYTAGHVLHCSAHFTINCMHFLHSAEHTTLQSAEQTIKHSSEHTTMHGACEQCNEEVALLHLSFSRCTSDSSDKFPLSSK